jgi:hypothetical protein
MGAARSHLYRRIVLRCARRCFVRADVQVIADRAEKAAVIVTTSLPFSEWSQVIANPRLCKALIDRADGPAARYHHRSRPLPVPPHHGSASGQIIRDGTQNGRLLDTESLLRANA